MIERDYIMRMIDMLAKVLARILFLNTARDFPRAASELAAASRNLLGIDHEILLMMADDQLIELLGNDDALAAPKCFVVGMLLEADAELARAQGEPAEQLLVKSLSLLTASYQRQGGPITEAHEKTIEDLAQRLRAYELPVGVGDRLFAYFESTGQFGRAEDILFELIDRDPAHIEAGIAFYRRLSSLDDAALERGGLPREEVNEGMQELQNRRTS